MRKRRHHYVPKWYLEAWAEHGRVFCLRNGQIVHPALKHIAVEEDFDAVRDLMPEDVEVIRRGIIAASGERARAIHERLLTAFVFVAHWNRVLSERPDTPEETIRVLREVVSNLDEDYHAAIEDDLRLAVKCMRSGSVEFFSDVLLAGPFLRALALQYLRTKKVREAMRSRVRMPVQGANMDHVWGPMIHMLAVNVGASLLRDRSHFRIVLLRNETGTPFITGDQPVINVDDDRDLMGIPREVEYYYPLSPTIAMLYVQASKAPDSHCIDVSKADVQGYNSRIAEHHHDQLYSNSEASLKGWTTLSLQ